MDKQEQTKQKFIQTLITTFPENEAVKETAQQMQEDSLKDIVNAMIMGMAKMPQYDALIPAVQEAMDVLREFEPDTNESAEKTILGLRTILSAPNTLPVLQYNKEESPEQIANRVVRHMQEWTND